MKHQKEMHIVSELMGFYGQEKLNAKNVVRDIEYHNYIYMITMVLNKSSIQRSTSKVDLFIKSLLYYKLNCCFYLCIPLWGLLNCHHVSGEVGRQVICLVVDFNSVSV